MNEDLAEAIALGHDIGHTPFGHEGERVLDLVLSGEADYKELHYKINYTGFKHNFNSLKILDIIEVKYANLNGLNLTWQVLEGILKHTKIKNNNRFYDIERFLMDNENNEFNNRFKELLEYADSVTLEGQIVALADEIAQRQHDLDDGMRDEGLGLKYDEVLKKINEYIYDILTTFGNNVEPEIRRLLDDLDARIKNREKENMETEKDDEANKNDEYQKYKRNTIIRDIIEYFICDVTLMSFKNIDKLAEECLIIEDDRKFFNKKLITYSRLGEELDKKLAKWIKNRIVNSNEVNKFDGKANYVIKRLFKAYYSNPRQMSSFALERLSSQISKNAKIYDIQLILDYGSSPHKVKNISFSKNKPEEVNSLIKYLKMEIDIDKLKYPTDVNNYIDPHGEKKVFLKDQLEWINKMPLSKVMKEKDDIKFIKCMLEDHFAFLSIICDYISGMTDNYAGDEYRNLYQT